MKRPGRYLLQDRRAVPCDDLLTWARAFEKQIGDRHVGDTRVGNIRVSTVFLGLDHQFGEGPPLLFETMIFGGEHSDYCERYSTWEEASAGHQVACKFAFGESWMGTA